MSVILPFTYPWFFRKLLKGVMTVLDLGCGDGKFMAILNKERKYKVTGVELFNAYIKSAEKTGVFERVVKGDVRKIRFPPKSYDAVVCSQVVEHLTKDDGKTLLSKMAKAAKKVVIVGTPNGHFHQEAYDKNVLQKHLSFWESADFRKMGYKTYGQAMKFIYGENGLLNTSLGRSPLRYSLYLLSYILSPLAYFYPSLGAHIIAVRKKGRNV
ncbi:hypothetical protein A2115_03065 [Candidatus Woesebacteria bacterium GWA1_41_8]|uniref:Methyltransferase domain-containing protein n=1 Tax=Candidatus Woesebacteria bacterium GWA1_41_8 TaxID=1802471 RepID=A0A1F7WIM7_9BACT|nr:MAG: hypothetical protein A2115_03065 [Candidatus Woesebacteria bacterium GWA1_41_8]